jgi:hypothetical protein
MNRFVLSLGFAAATFASSAAFAGEPVGIPACDDFLTKYDACVSGKIPAAQQPAFKASVDQMRSTWAMTAKNPSAKPALEGACKSAAEQTKASTAAYGCAW